SLLARVQELVDGLGLQVPGRVLRDVVWNVWWWGEGADDRVHVFLGHFERRDEVIGVGEVSDVCSEVRLLLAGDAEASVLIRVRRVLPQFAFVHARVRVSLVGAEPACDEVGVIEVEVLVWLDSVGDADPAGLAPLRADGERTGHAAGCAELVGGLPSGGPNKDVADSGLRQLPAGGSLGCRFG